MKVTIQKSIFIISILHLLAGVVHSAEPSTSVTLTRATELPTTIDITKRATSATDSSTGTGTTSDTNDTNLDDSSVVTNEAVATSGQSDNPASDVQTTAPIVEPTTAPPVSTTNPQPTTTTNPTTTPNPTTSYYVSTSSDQPTSSVPTSSSAPAESTTSSSSETAPYSSSTVVPPSTTPLPVVSSSSFSSSNRHTTSAVTSNSSSTKPSSTSSNAPTASATSQPQESSSNKTGTIVGAVVGSVAGVALIAGLLTWFNRKGGCTKRRKDEIDQSDYTIDMNQTDFAPSAGAAAIVGGGGAAAAAAGKSSTNEPISPFDHSRRFVPPTATATNNYDGNEMNYDGYNNGYPQHQQGDYGYYDDAAATGYPQHQQQPYDQYGYDNTTGYEQQYDSNRHEVNHSNDNYTYYTGPSASRTSGSDWNQGSASYPDKPNLRDQKPNQA